MSIDKKIKRTAGFSLIEMLLVMVIVSTIFVLGANYMQQKTRAERIDRTVIQVQQILNGALAYYVEKKDWPLNPPPTSPTTWASVSILQNAGYLPPGAIINSPWGPSPHSSHPGSYMMGSDNAKKRFSVLTFIGTGPLGVSNGKILIGKLPSAQYCNNYNVDTGACAVCTGTAADHCFLAVSVPPPGQNLNNATGINYVGVMHSGACVKAPVCPNSSMDPMVIVVPSSVIGANEAPTGTNCNATNLQNCSVNSYPITAYVGYSTPLTAALTTAGYVSPQSCADTTLVDCVSDSNNTKISANAGDRYWRICIRVDTSSGRVTPTNNPWGQLMGTALVFTRCAPTTENNKNSGFNVYQ